MLAITFGDEDQKSYYEETWQLMKPWSHLTVLNKSGPVTLTG